VRQDRLRILQLIAEFPWFYHEFSKAGGSSWLEREVDLIQDVQANQECMKFLFDALYSVEEFQSVDVVDSSEPVPHNDPIGSGSYHQLRMYINLIRQCLTRRHPQKTHHVQFPEQVRRLKSVLRQQNEQRKPTVTKTGTNVNANPNPYSYVQIWSNAEWEEWSAFVDEIIVGLERGYILDIHPRIEFDPDGICASTIRLIGPSPSPKAPASRKYSSDSEDERLAQWEHMYQGFGYNILR
jgi:hypothetical protein